ncbi:transcriptional regulator, partial [Klebsiella pneumoniae]
GERCDGLAPYRLISLDGCWYLTGELNGHITVHTLATIHAVTVLNTTFTPRKRLSQLTTQAGFIRALPHFSCIREVLSPGPSEEEQGSTMI